ncbi:putative odorant receptor 92a [Leguminivora glycinivorella]|uniref:putative odorant receptor 92a n=1 Tax=Leguminivora glycinivorella TaxID=1035111 RepID=UPI00200F1645|nr:putative odorant receptor 92a [Leguminivora glycinivorella]
MSVLFDESLISTEFLFKYIGIYLDRPIQNTVEHIIKFRSLYIINFLWLNTDTIGEIAWIIQGAMYGKSLIELTYMAPCSTYCIVANIKSLSLLLNQDKVHELFKRIRSVENNTDIGDEGVKKKIVAEGKEFLKAVIKALGTINVVTLVLFSTSPLLLMALEYKKLGKIEFLLPFLIIYPFIDPYDIHYWPFAYVHQVWSTYLVLTQVSGTDCIFYTCCTSICTQFRLLQVDIENIITERHFDENEFQEKFKKLTVRHESIMQLVGHVERIYTKSTLFNFVTSSFMICLTGFNVTAIGDVAFALSFLAFLLMSLMQIYLLCFYGDMVMTSSMEVSSAMYKSKWYTVNAKTAKLLYVVQMRARKPSKLTAFSYADVNLKAFTKILSTAWSYFALLKTIDSPTRA